MRSNSDGAMARRALAPLDADIMESLKAKLKMFQTEHVAADAQQPGATAFVNWNDSQQQVGDLPPNYRLETLNVMPDERIQSQPVMEGLQIDPTIDAFGSNYSKLRVKVNSSFPTQEEDVYAFPEGLVSWSQISKIPPDSALGKILPPIDSSRGLNSSPSYGKSSHNPHEKIIEIANPLSKRSDSCCQERQEPTCMNMFWVMWIAGFILPILWIFGVFGLCSRNPCGFAAGMANSTTLILAAILVVIFVA